MRSEIGVGIIGCGSVARWKYVKNLAEMSGVSLRAFYGGRAEEFQQQYGAPGSAVCRDLAEFLAREDVDAVCICTPNNSHAEIALAALRARKHVLCEKPMAISAEDAVRMVETAEQMGVLLTVGHQSRFSPAAQALYRQLREGAFGSLYFARASMVRRMGIPTWGHFFDPAVQGGGCLIDLGTHALDLALWLLNDFSPAYCCAGIFRGPGDSPTPANRWGTWDPAMLRTETGAFGQVVLQSGTVLSLDISWALHVPEDREETVTLCGTAAGAELFPGGYTISGTQGARLVTTRYQMPEEEQSAKLIRCGMGLVLGGVEIPWDCGLLGHSDADVLTHAVMDALCGAAKLGDIGKLFPDSDPRYAGISSLELLRQVAALLQERGWAVVNIDATLIAQAPKVGPYRPEMEANLSAALGTDADRVNVKATTEEHLGFTGDGSGMAAHAVALLERLP